MTIIERAREILVEIREEDQSDKLYTWEHTRRAYNLKGLNPEECSPLFEDLNSMREFEEWLLKDKSNLWIDYVDCIAALSTKNPYYSLVEFILAPPDVRFAAWLAVMENELKP